MLRKLGSNLRLFLAYCHGVPARDVETSTPAYLPASQKHNVTLNLALFFQRHRILPNPYIRRAEGVSGSSQASTVVGIQSMRICSGTLLYPIPDRIIFDTMKMAPWLRTGVYPEIHQAAAALCNAKTSDVVLASVFPHHSCISDRKQCRTQETPRRNYARCGPGRARMNGGRMRPIRARVGT